jgi:hypothetical protein
MNVEQKLILMRLELKAWAGREAGEKTDGYSQNKRTCGV